MQRWLCSCSLKSGSDTFVFTHRLLKIHSTFPSFLQFLLPLECLTGQRVQSSTAQLGLLRLSIRWSLGCNHTDLGLVLNFNRWFSLLIWASFFTVINFLFVHNLISFGCLLIRWTNIPQIFTWFDLWYYSIALGGHLCFWHAHDLLFCGHWQILWALVLMIVNHCWAYRLFAIPTLEHDAALLVKVYLTLRDFGTAFFALNDQLLWAVLA